MPVGLSQPADILPVAGIELATVAAGVRYQNRPDLVLMRLAEGSTTAAVFTQNKCCAAPVLVAKDHLSQVSTRALLINSGNANAVTGELGMQNTLKCCAVVAEQLGLEPREVLPFSTGVIGEQLDMSAMIRGIQAVGTDLSADSWLLAAEAIMTTDTVAKAVSKTVELDGKVVTITGIAKGSGMICPDMATMLAYVATDAALPEQWLDSCLRRVVDASFNRITVDSDTSTNDALVLVATGKSGVRVDELEEQISEQFYQSLETLMIELATSIVRDAEGATKFVKIVVNGARTNSDARAIVYSIAHSPLVKTALFASDPNWGRILMALGKAPVDELDMTKVNIQIGDVSLIEHGEPAPSYEESRGKAIFEQQEIDITIDLGVGDSDFHVWTSDLSHDYVSINADYRS